MAVLYRSNKRSIVSTELELAFMANQIPYMVVRGKELFTRRVAKDVLAALTISVDPRVALPKHICTNA